MEDYNAFQSFMIPINTAINTEQKLITCNSRDYEKCMHINNLIGKNEEIQSRLKNLLNVNFIPTISKYRLYRKKKSLGIKLKSVPTLQDRLVTARLMKDILEEIVRGKQGIKEGNVRIAALYTDRTSFMHSKKIRDFKPTISPLCKNPVIIKEAEQISEIEEKIICCKKHRYMTKAHGTKYHNERYLRI